MTMLTVMLFVLTPGVLGLGVPSAQDEYQMTAYYMYFLDKGPAWSAAETPENAALQQAHLANFAKLHREGRLAVVGPFGDDTPMRGMGLLRAASIEEARAVAEADPAVEAGHLTVRIHRWWGPKDWFGVAPWPWELVTYQFGFLVSGPKADEIPESELEKLQAAHLAYMDEQARAGRLIMAGPFEDAGRLRGVVVYDVGSVEEAVRIASNDPAVKAGRLAVEMHPWMTAKGMIGNHILNPHLTSGPQPCTGRAC